MAAIIEDIGRGRSQTWVSNACRACSSGATMTDERSCRLTDLGRATPIRSLLDVRVDLLCLLPMLLGCGLFLTCALCLLLSCKPCLLRLPASRVRLLAVLASFDALLIELRS